MRDRRNDLQYGVLSALHRYRDPLGAESCYAPERPLLVEYELVARPAGGREPKYLYSALP